MEEYHRLLASHAEEQVAHCFQVLLSSRFGVLTR